MRCGRGVSPQSPLFSASKRQVSAAAPSSFTCSARARSREGLWGRGRGERQARAMGEPEVGGGRLPARLLSLRRNSSQNSSGGDLTRALPSSLARVLASFLRTDRGWNLPSTRPGRRWVCPQG